MSDKVEVHNSGGIGFFGLLQIVFIILKLCGVITWSWVKVLIPLWIGLGIWALILLIGGIALLIAWLKCR